MTIITGLRACHVPILFSRRDGTVMATVARARRSDDVGSLEHELLEGVAEARAPSLAARPVSFQAGEGAREAAG